MWLPILLVVSLTGKINISLSAFAPENLVSRDEFGSPFPRLSPFDVLPICTIQNVPTGKRKEFRYCVCVVIPFILDVRLVDAPAGVTQEEGHTGFLHLPSAVLALILLSREGFSHPFPSSTMKSNFVYPRINRSPLVGHDAQFV